MFLINTANYYVKKWRTNGWKKNDGSPIANKKDIMKLNELCQKVNVVWKYVKGLKAIIQIFVKLFLN
jgi:ribonuclease HI